MTFFDTFLGLRKDASNVTEEHASTVGDESNETEELESNGIEGTAFTVCDFVYTSTRHGNTMQTNPMVLRELFYMSNPMLLRNLLQLSMTNPVILRELLLVSANPKATSNSELITEALAPTVCENTGHIKSNACEPSN